MNRIPSNHKPEIYGMQYAFSLIFTEYKTSSAFRTIYNRRKRFHFKVNTNEKSLEGKNKKTIYMRSEINECESCQANSIFFCRY